MLQDLMFNIPKNASHASQQNISNVSTTCNKPVPNGCQTHKESHDQTQTHHDRGNSSKISTPTEEVTSISQHLLSSKSSFFTLATLNLINPTFAMVSQSFSEVTMYHKPYHEAPPDKRTACAPGQPQLWESKTIPITENFKMLCKNNAVRDMTGLSRQMMQDPGKIISSNTENPTPWLTKGC